MIPLPFTCQHETYSGTGKDEHGNETPNWETPVARECFWYSEQDGRAIGAAEPSSAPTGGDLVAVDLTLVIDASVTVDHRDRFTVAGRKFEVIGLPKDWDHGPFGYQPNRLVLDLKWVG